MSTSSLPEDSVTTQEAAQATTQGLVQAGQAQGATPHDVELSPQVPDLSAASPTQTSPRWKRAIQVVAVAVVLGFLSAGIYFFVLEGVSGGDFSTYLRVLLVVNGLCAGAAFGLSFGGRSISWFSRDGASVFVTLIPVLAGILSVSIAGLLANADGTDFLIDLALLLAPMVVAALVTDWVVAARDART